MTLAVQVAVAVIINSDNQVLISKRASDVHQPDCWEFPGGKVESNESVASALVRELKEELGIEILEYKYLMSVPYDYGDKKVCLQTYRVSKYSGQEHGCEKQPIKWVDIDELSTYQFPEANIAILNCLNLPDMIQITGHFSNLEELLNKSKSCIDKGVSMIQFRAHQLDDESYRHHAECLLNLCHQHQVKLILNRAIDVAAAIKADGIHLNRFELMKYQQRPCAEQLSLSASCHNIKELKQAEALSADFCLLSPVKTARSHEAGVSLGYEKFAELVASCSVPVYALGGMQLSDIERIKRAGGFGIAAVSGNW